MHARHHPAVSRQIKQGQLKAPSALPSYVNIVLKRAAWNKKIESERQGTTGSHESFMKLGIREFEPGHMLLFLLHRQTTFWLRISDLFLLPINYLFELGALLLWRR